MGSGIGSYLIGSLMAYLYQEKLETLHYIDESVYTLFQIKGEFWNHYFNPIWIQSKNYVFSNRIDLLYTDAEIKATQSIFCFENNTREQSMLKLQVIMKKIWQLNPVIKRQITDAIDNFPLKNTRFLTVVIRQGDKRTLEKHLNMLDAQKVFEVLQTDKKYENITGIHLTTDSYSEYKILNAKLSHKFKIYTTCTENKKGFFLADVKVTF